MREGGGPYGPSFLARVIFKLKNGPQKLGDASSHGFFYREQKDQNMLIRVGPSGLLKKGEAPKIFFLFLSIFFFFILQFRLQSLLKAPFFSWLALSLPLYPEKISPANRFCFLRSPHSCLAAAEAAAARTKVCHKCI